MNKHSKTDMYEAHDWAGEQIVASMLNIIDPDPDREGLRETPKRVAKAWHEFFGGYHVDPADFLKTFTDGANDYDEMVLVDNIPVFSHCEHHLVPFIGVAHVAYIPDGRIVGLSKLARVVDAFARRLQVQERLTVQIADCINDALKPRGVGVIVRAQHMCMAMRGVSISGSWTTTSALRGVFLDKPEVRSEFMGLIRG
jgi:GTP cyclohydrolase IA